MQILKQFNNLFLLEKQIISLGFITFLNNQNKQYQNFPTEQHNCSFSNQYKWLNTANAKLSDTQQKKLKTAVKYKTGTTLKMSSKVFAENDLSHELLVTTRQKARLRNVFNNNMSTGLKLSKVQISTIIQSRGF